MSLKKKAVSSFFWTGLEQFGSQVVNLVMSVILARLLVPEHFGLIGMIILFVSLGKSILDMGLSQSLVRSQNPYDEDFSSVFYFNVVVGILIYGLIFLCAPAIATFFEQPILVSIIRWYALVIIFHGFGNIQQIKIIKSLKFKMLFKIHIPAITSGGLAGVVMAYNGFGVWSLVVAALVQSFLLTFLLWVIGKWIPKKAWSLSRIKHHFNYGYKLFFAGVFDVAYANIYSVLIGKYFSVSELGFYNRADTLKQIPVQNVGAVLNKVSFPLFAKIQDDNDKLRFAYTHMMKFVMLIIAPVLLISAALAEPLFRWILTEKWLPAVPYYQILCFAGLLYPMNAYNLNILKVKGRSDLFLKLEVVKKVVAVAIIIITLPYGIIPMLWGSVVISVIAFFINSHYTGLFIQYPAWSQLRDILPILVVALIVGGFMFYGSKEWGSTITSDGLHILVFGALGILLYLMLVFIFQKKAIQEALAIIQSYST